MMLILDRHADEIASFLHDIVQLALSSPEVTIHNEQVKILGFRAAQLTECLDHARHGYPDSLGKPHNKIGIVEG